MSKQIKIYMICIAKAEHTSLYKLSIRANKTGSYFSTMSKFPTTAKLTRFTRLTEAPIKELRQSLQGSRQPVMRLLHKVLCQATSLKRFRDFLLLVALAYGGFNSLALKRTHGKSTYLTIKPNLYGPTMSKRHFRQMAKDIHSLTGYPLQPMLDQLAKITPMGFTVRRPIRVLAINYLRSYRTYYYHKIKCVIPARTIINGSDNYAYKELRRIANTLHLSSKNWYRIMDGDNTLLPELRYHAMQSITDVMSLRRCLKTILSIHQNIKRLTSSKAQYQQLVNALSRSHSVSSKSIWRNIIKDVGRWTQCSMALVLKKLDNIHLSTYTHISLNYDNAKSLSRYIYAVKKYRQTHHQMEKIPNVSQIYMTKGYITRRHLMYLSKMYSIPVANLRAITDGRRWPQHHFLALLIQQITNKASLQEYFRTLIYLFGDKIYHLKHGEKRYNFLLNVLYHNPSYRNIYIRAAKILCYEYKQPLRPVLHHINSYHIGKKNEPKIAKIADDQIHLIDMRPVRTRHIKMIYRRQVLYFIRATIQLKNLHLQIIPCEMKHRFLTMPDSQLIMALQFYGEAIHVPVTILMAVACNNKSVYQERFLYKASKFIHNRQTLYNFLRVWLQLNGTTVTDLSKSFHISTGYLKSSVIQASRHAVVLHKIIDKLNDLVPYTWSRACQNKIFQKLNL